MIFPDCLPLRWQRRLLCVAVFAALASGCGTAPGPGGSGSAGATSALSSGLYYWPQQEDAADDDYLCMPASLLNLDDLGAGDGHDDLWSRVRSGYALEGDVDESRVDRQLDVYGNKQRLFDSIAPGASKYMYHVVERLEERNMPLELALLPMLESGYNPQAVSPSRAAGIWQIIPGTGARLGLEQTSWYDGRKDVIASTEAALDYLEQLHKQFDGDWYLALAAYNAGEGNVQRAIERNRRLGKPTDYWSLPLSQQACNFVPRLLALSRVLEDPVDHGVEISPIPNQPSLVAVEVGQQVNLQRAAARAGIDANDLLSSNPAYKRGYTAPGTSNTLLVPNGEQRSFLAAVASGTSETGGAERYRIRPGDTLRGIARLHETTPEALKAVNGLSGDAIVAGAYLQLPRDAVQPTQRYPTTESVALKRKGIYVIKAGDSLSSIAKRFSTTVPRLAQLNAMEPGATLRIGQQIRVRSAQGTALHASAPRGAEAQSTRVEYQVRKGDSLSRIAARFSVSVPQLLRWNSLPSANAAIHPGQKLVLYVGSAMASLADAS
jgi:membrane-bound lytic murein transglycosylase D